MLELLYYACRSPIEVDKIGTLIEIQLNSETSLMVSPKTLTTSAIQATLGESLAAALARSGLDYIPVASAQFAAVQPALAIARSVRLKALLFARPESETTQKQILPHLTYFHFESGDRFDFVCMGYFEATDGEPVVARVAGKAWAFSDERFIKVKDELQSKTKWKYSGGSDLILCNEVADLSSAHSAPSLDMRTALCLSIDKLLRDSSILSFENFFQGVVDFAKSTSGHNPTWKLSDKNGLRLALEALKGSVIELLPKGVRKQVSDAFTFAVRDIALPEI